MIKNVAVYLFKQVLTMCTCVQIASIQSEELMTCKIHIIDNNKVKQYKLISICRISDTYLYIVLFSAY